MKPVRSDSPEVARCIASTGALVCWCWSSLVVACIASAPGLLIVLALRLIVSIRAAVWLGVPVFLALNIFLLWRLRSPRLNWVLAGCADRVYVRLFVKRGRGTADVRQAEVIVLEASEITSIWARTVEVFLDGSKPRIVERLVIEPSQAIAQSVSDRMPSVFGGVNAADLRVYWDNEEGQLALGWKRCQPALRVFLQQLTRECPSVVIGPEGRSELDLNGIWRGISRNLRNDVSAQGRQMLVQAKRLGFGCECAGLLSRYKRMSFGEAGAYLAGIEREEAETGHSAAQP